MASPRQKIPPRRVAAPGLKSELALRGLISEAGREATGYAATILGYDQPRGVATADLLDSAVPPAALVRVEEPSPPGWPRRPCTGPRAASRVGTTSPPHRHRLDP
jgi:hypothetical protein